MSKLKNKKFNTGLEEALQNSLFNDNEHTVVKPSVSKTNPTTSVRSKAGAGNTKSFAFSMEELLQEVVDEIVEDKKEAIRTHGIEKVADKIAQNKSKKPVIGLDMLIRNTIEEGAVIEPTTKRLTFVFDKEKVEQLKSLAEMQKSRIRDIVDELVSNYIVQHLSQLDK